MSARSGRDGGRRPHDKQPRPGVVEASEWFLETWPANSSSDDSDTEPPPERSRSRVSRSDFSLAGEEYVRLPCERKTALRAIGEPSVPIWLSHHAFRLELSDPPVLIDPEGGRTPLREGRNRIGRASGNEILVNPEYRDLSRRHFSIEVRGGRPVAITDLSSRGTFVPRAWLAGDVAAA